MSLADFVKATFWGAIVIFALITFVCWFIAKPPQILMGIGSLGFMIFIAWLGLKLST
jgi:hypothetical protein